MALEFLNYKNIRESNKEFTRSDLWEVTFLTVPQTYFPGKEFIDQRCTAIQPGIPNSIDQISHRIRGFQVHQAGLQTTNSSATLSFIDREDLAIRTWVENWKNLMADRDTLEGNRKSTYCCDIKITYFNTSRIPIQEITLYNCMLTDASPMEDATSDPQTTSDISMTLAYEHFKRKYLNGVSPTP
jgi:hypothetical protein